VESHMASAIFMDQGEGRTGYVFRRGRMESFCNAFNQRRLARAKVPSQKHNCAGLQMRSQLLSKLCRFVSGMSGENGDVKSSSWLLAVGLHFWLWCCFCSWFCFWFVFDLGFANY